MTRGLQAAVVAGAIGCVAPAPAYPVDAAPRRHVGRGMPTESQRATPAIGGSHGGPPRDPFVRPVLTRSASPVDDRTAGDGLAAASSDDIVVRGVVQTRGDRVALVQTPDGRHYRVRAGERLRDGRVQAVSTEGLLIVPDTTAGARRDAAPVRKPIGADSSRQ